MNQLAALCWLKWRLFRNAFTRRRGAGNRVASLLTLAATLCFSLLVAAGMGFAAYAVLADGRVAHDGAGPDGVFVLFMMLSAVYLTWATVPLSLGGGSQFAPGRLLLYPVTLRKLFAIDLLSELTSLSSIFAVPAVLAIALGAGWASGSVGRSLFVALCALACGVALGKLLATSVGALIQRRRARGEALLALIGAVAAFTGVLFGQAERFFSNTQTFPPVLRWTPPGAVSLALTSGLRARGGGGDYYWFGVALLLMYAAAASWLTYRIALRSLTGGGGGGGRGRARENQSRVAATQPLAAAGWRLPLLSPPLSGIVEKELRYALRNAQLRTMALMPVVLTFSLSLLGTGPRGGDPLALFADFAPYMEGGRAAFSVLYVFIITSALSCNLFGYEGGGMRTLVLVPVARKIILVGKNLAVLAVTFLISVLVTLINQLIYRDLTGHALAFTALCFVIDAAAFTLLGNWLSVRFPKRLNFGRRMNASGMAGLLLLPAFLVVAAPPVLAVLAGYLTRSTAIVYVILAAFAVAGVASYLLLINRQGRALARRELEILEAVAGREGDE